MIEAKCPHCGAKATAKQTKVVTPMYKEITYRCWNLNCGFVWVAALEPVRALSPSAIPNPEIRIPLSPHVRVKVLQCQLALEEELHS